MKPKIKVAGLISLVFVLFGCNSTVKPEKTEAISFPYKFKSEIIEKLEASTESWKYQLAAWDYSNIGAYHETLKVWDVPNTRARKIDPEKFDSFQQNYTQQNALSFILNHADSNKVMIINEAHHQPYHRVFTTELLIALYEKGYRYLGLETLNHDDLEINTRKYPVYSSGTYSIEPQFGNLIRKALEMGYILFPYESDGSGKDREIGQAKNIQKQMENDPEGKYLIHCGFAHAAEGEYKSWGKAMAGRLLEFTGIDPLTINQTEFTEKSTDSLANPVFQQVDLNESSVFVDEDGVSFKHESHPEWFDIMVFHPRTKMKSGRPDWLFRNNRKKVEVELNGIDMKLPALILAYKENEDRLKSIPADVVYAEKSERNVTLVLEKGNYVVIIQNKEKVSYLLRVDVP